MRQFANNLRRGNTVLEAAMLLPIVLTMLVGMVQIGKITYTYYTLRKAVYSIGMYLSAQQGVNFCDPADPAIAAAVSFGLNGTTDNSADSYVTGLTSDMIKITPEQVDSAGAVTPYGGGCVGSPAFDGTPPDFILIAIPNGYQMVPRIPFVPMDPIALKPMVKVPYGGT